MEEIKKEGETKNKIDEARELVERMEKANEEHKKLLKVQEELITKQILGGKSSAGSAPIPVKEETPQEYTARFLKEGFNPLIV